MALRVKRLKRIKKILEFHRINFDMRPPFNIIVEEHFVQQALESQIFLLEQLPKLFQDNIHIFVTSCTLNILSQMGNHYSGALKICQTLETLNCRHRPKTSTEECFLEHIKVRPYVVAAQTVKLRNVVREQTFRGRPIIVMFFRGKVPSLEQPTPKMLSKAQKKEFRKLDQEENREIGTKTKKTKTLKNPNPLSCLRKKSEKNSCRVVKGVVRSIK